MPEITPDALVILSKDDLSDVTRAQNSAAWRIDISRARSVRYIILAHNMPDDATKHRRAFMIAKVKGFVPRVEKGEPEGRWAVTFDQYAEVPVDDPSIDDAWRKGDRFPVQYRSANKVLGVDPETLTYRTVPEKTLEWSYSDRVRRESNKAVEGLSIAEAKAGLAHRFGCKSSDIDIVIRA